MTAAELREIERLVNAQIRAQHRAETRVMDYEGAVAAGAMALFGEKYDKDVRVLRMGEFSMELCGGTHVQRSGDIGFFKIVSEGGVAAGVRRIEAITGAGRARLRRAAAMHCCAMWQAWCAARARICPTRCASARAHAADGEGDSRAEGSAGLGQGSRSGRRRGRGQGREGGRDQAWMAPMPARCVRRWISSRSDSRRPSWCWLPSRARPRWCWSPA